MQLHTAETKMQQENNFTIASDSPDPTDLELLWFPAQQTMEWTENWRQRGTWYPSEESVSYPGENSVCPGSYE